MFGGTVDGSDQGIVFQKAVNKGKVPFSGIVLTALIAVFFIVLCSQFNSPIFPLLLLVFWICNYVIWAIFIKYIMDPYYLENKKFYSNQSDFLTTKRFEIVETFLYGTWHRIRFLSGTLLLIPTTILSITNWGDSLFSSHDKKTLCVSVLILVFVLIFELWIWYFRLKRKFSLTTLTEIIEQNDDNSQDID